MAGAEPDVESNPYAVISERNVFHLNPPPPPPAPDAPKVELPEIKLSGFLRIGNTAHALFSYSPKDKKEAPIYYYLANGEKEGILEVVKIHEDRGEVEIIDSGTPLTLSLKNDTLEPKETVANKGTPGEAEAPRGGKFPGGRDHVPGRAAYRFPTPGEGHGGGGALGFPLPARRTRVPE